MNPHTATAVVRPGPRPTDAEIDIFGLTHKGKVRPDNQDHFLICQLRKQIEVHSTSIPDVASTELGTERLAFLSMVADGVGGSERGEEASRFALQGITKYVAESIHSFYASDATDHDALAKSLSDAAIRCHSDLVRQAGKDSKAGMATTLTMLIGVWPWAYVVQLGDSRYYLLRDGELMQISRDQTIAQDLIDQGVMSQGVGLRSRWANVLSSALGGRTATPVVTRIGLDRDDVHLLCSDGLTKHVPDEQIALRLRSMTGSEQAARALLQDALDAGGTDNITIIIGRTSPLAAARALP